MATTVLLESVVLAAVYLQISLGWIIIYRATRVLNFATGQFLLFAALLYATLSVTLGVPAILAVALVAGATAMLAMGSYEVLMRPLAGRPVFAQIIVTVGLSIVLSTLMAMVWGSDQRALSSPVGGEVHRLPGGAVFTDLDLVIIAVSVALFAVLLVFLQRSRPGRQMRATAESPLLASQSGMNINLIFRLGWGVAGVAMAVGGVGYAYLTLVSANIVELGLRGLAPALIGGLDDVRGAVIGAVVIAAAENLAATYLGGDVRNVVPFVVILLVLAIRPYGLFGSPEVRRV